MLPLEMCFGKSALIPRVNQNSLCGFILKAEHISSSHEKNSSEKFKAKIF